MKGIKTFLVATIIILCFAPINLNSVSATTNTYLRVINENTPFCLDEQATTPIFYLPYTYYVKVLRATTYSLHIECYGKGTTKIDGYVPLNTLYEDGLSTVSPYLDLEITTCASTPLYSDYEQTNRVMFIFSNRTLNYYGKIENSANKIMYFVGYGNQLGYVSEDALFPFSVPIHPNELTFLEKDEPTIEETPNTLPPSEDFFSLKIVIIVLLVFAGVIALFVAFTNKNRKNITTVYYDENDDE